MMKRKILFLCVQNSARSQMAEAWFNHLCGDQWEAFSAGTEPGTLNPLAVEVMREVGLDLSGAHTKSAFDLYRDGGHSFEYLVAVCAPAELKRCPVFPGRAERLHWPMPDVATLPGTREEQLTAARAVRDQLRRKAEAWNEVFCSPDAGANDYEVS